MHGCGSGFLLGRGLSGADVPHLAEIEHQQHHIRKDSGGRVGAADAVETDSSDQHERDKNPCDQFGNARQHGLAGIAHSLQMPPFCTGDGSPCAFLHNPDRTDRLQIFMEKNMLLLAKERKLW